MQSVSEDTKIFGGSNVRKSDVFVTGDYKPKHTTLEPSKSVPRPLLIYYPDLKGSYPVLMFLHGFFLNNNYYSHLLEHVSSHGYIGIAPQLYPFSLIPPRGEEDVKSVEVVVDWISSSLQLALPNGVIANLQKIAIAGHSRGGQTALAIALRHQTSLAFKLLIGVEPVAGPNNYFRTGPGVLTYQPRSFDLSIPVAVIGAGLGSEKRKWFMRPSAPDGLSHNEFFNECKPPCYHFVAKEFGHMDMLDDGLVGPVGVLAGCMCKNGTGEKELMRRGVGGIVVALLNAWLEGRDEDLVAIVARPEIAPVVLDPVRFVPA